MICIAEIGCNHRGELATAKRMVEIVGTYCTEHFQLCTERPEVAVKFQKRSARAEHFTIPHPNPANSYGETYGDHRAALEFTIDQHAELKQHAETFGAVYSCSVWDVEAAYGVMDLEPQWIKVPSACNLDFDMLGVLSDFPGDIHVSLGMTSRVEVQSIVDELERLDALDRTVLYACTSTYPATYEDVRLDELTWLNQNYGPHVKALGFSGHHNGIAVDIAAVTYGVEYIERHFTLNRTWKGTDHAASLEPDGFRKLVRDVENVRRSFGVKPQNGLLDIEQEQRAKLKVLPQEAA